MHQKLHEKAHVASVLPDTFTNIYWPFSIASPNMTKNTSFVETIAKWDFPRADPD